MYFDSEYNDQVTKLLGKTISEGENKSWAVNACELPSNSKQQSEEQQSNAYQIFFSELIFDKPFLAKKYILFSRKTPFIMTKNMQTFNKSCQHRIIVLLYQFSLFLRELFSRVIQGP